MILGYFLVRPIPLPSEPLQGAEHGLVTNDAAASTTGFMDDSRTRLLDHDQSDIDTSDTEGYPHPHTHEHTRSRSLSVASSGVAPPHPHDRVDDSFLNIFGTELWMNGDFWLLFIILSICACLPLLTISINYPRICLVSGTGLMCECNKIAAR